MDARTVAVLALGGWIVAGLVVWLVMRQKGHDSASWLMFGLLLGPLAVVPAVDPWWRKEARHVAFPSGGPPERHSGPTDVVVGYDGSPESHAAIALAVDLLGPRLGRLTLATVIPYEADPAAEPQARAALEQQAARYPDRHPQVRVLDGHPSTVLASLAAEGGYDLLVIGTRGTGVSKRLLGSAALELARHSKVPVLLAGG